MRLTAILLGLLAATAAFGAATRAPNIVIFLADDLGWGDLGVQGHPVIKTPNLDAFAKQGARLTQCYAASAVCSPDRKSVCRERVYSNV